jgi:peptide/nickel transport system substrate-binding protein
MLHDRRTLKLALLLVVVLIAAACLAAVGQALAADSGSPAPAASSTGGKVQLKIGWMSEPDNLNWCIGYEDASYEIWSLNYDFLFNTYPDGSHGPELALERPTVENGGISANGKVYTIKIRSGVKWQDGQPLTASDVAFTYNFVVQKAVWNWMPLTTGIKEVVAVDPTTVKIICDYPKADIATCTIPIVPEHIWKDISGWIAQNTYQVKLPLVGSGPFQVTEFKRKGYVKMVRNPDYWGERPAVDEIYFQNYQNADILAQELKNGTLDAAAGMPRAQFDNLKTDKTFGTVAWNCLNFDYLNFNCCTGPSKGNPVLQDVQFRRALATAIDKDKLIQVACGGYGVLGTTVLTPDTWANPDYHWSPPADQVFNFDIEKAKQMLDAAGYKDTNGDGIREDKSGKPIKIRLWAAADLLAQQSDGKLIAGWWKELGINIDFQIMDVGSIDDHFWNYEGDTYVPDYDTYLENTTGFLDPGQTVPWWTTDQIGNWNEGCWSNAEFDKLSAEQASIMDPDQRVKVLDRMQEIMYSELPLSVLDYPKALQAYNTTRWTGWTPLKLGNGAPGPVFGSSFNRETYLNVKPIAQSKTSGGGGLSTTTIVIIVVAAVVVVAVIVWLVVRRRTGKRVTEEA